MYLVSELSVLCGVPIHTIRYYEKYGLLKAQKNKGKSNNYRYYPEEALERLELIEEGKSLGLSLTELKELMKAWYNERISIEQRIKVLEAQLQAFNEKEKKLIDVRDRINLLVDEMKKFI